MTPRRTRKREPFATVVLWPRRGRAKWAVRLEWQVVEGRAECVRCHVYPAVEQDPHELGLLGDPGRVDRSERPEPVTTSLLRSLPLGRLVEEGRRQHRDAGAALESAGATLTPEQRAAWKAGGAGRPPEYGPEHFERVADVYSRAWAAAKPPTKAVAARWGVEQSTAAKWVARTRRLGLLAPTSRGRAGGVSQVAGKKKPTARRKP